MKKKSFDPRKVPYQSYGVLQSLLALHPLDPFRVIILAGTHRNYELTGRLPTFLRRPTILGETTGKRLFWDAFNTLEERAPYAVQMKAVKHLCAYIKEKKHPRILVEIIRTQKGACINALHPSAYIKQALKIQIPKRLRLLKLKERSLFGETFEVNNKSMRRFVSLDKPIVSSTDPFPIDNPPLVELISDAEALDPFGSVLISIDLERKCSQIDLHPLATRALLFKTQHDLSFSEAYRVLNLPKKSYETARKDLLRKKPLFEKK